MLEALMLSCDTQITRVLQATLEKLAVAVRICSEAGAGAQTLCSEKFDAVIVDCDDLRGGLDLLQTLRKSPSNRSTIAFAVLNGTTTQQAFGMGANFVLQKPVSMLNAMRCFSAGLGLMAREQRRYFRHAAELEVTVVLGAGEQLRFTSTNLSEGGMAFRDAGPLSKGGMAKVSFTLPGAPGPTEARAEVMWVQGSGQCGLRFVDMPRKSREYLEAWLDAELKKTEDRAAKAHSAG